MEKFKFSLVLGAIILAYAILVSESFKKADRNWQRDENNFQKGSQTQFPTHLAPPNSQDQSRVAI